MVKGIESLDMDDIWPMSPPLQGCHKHGYIDPREAQVSHSAKQISVDLMQFFASQIIAGLGGNLRVCNEAQAVGILNLIQVDILVLGSCRWHTHSWCSCATLA